MKIFTVYDSKAKAYLTPFFIKTTGEALRQFTDIVNNKEHYFSQHPEDYSLFEIGTYDEQLGQVKQYDSNLMLANATEFVIQPQLTGVQENEINHKI